MRPRKTTLREPGVAGAYELVERRSNGSLVLRPQGERLSGILRETEGQIFRDEEFVAHLERVAASNVLSEPRATSFSEAAASSRSR